MDFLKKLSDQMNDFGKKGKEVLEVASLLSMAI